MAPPAHPQVHNSSLAALQCASVEQELADGTGWCCCGTISNFFPLCIFDISWKMTEISYYFLTFSERVNSGRRSLENCQIYYEWSLHSGSLWSPDWTQVTACCWTENKLEVCKVFQTSDTSPSLFANAQSRYVHHHWETLWCSLARQHHVQLGRAVTLILLLNWRAAKQKTDI